MWKDNKFRNMEPRIVSASPRQANRELIRSVLPKGSVLVPERFNNRREATGFFGQSLPGGTAPLSSSGGGGSAMYHTQRPYDPAIECFLEGSPINMADGTFKLIEEVRVGEKVIDKNGVVQTVEKQWSSGIPEQIVEVSSLAHLKFYSTLYHNWPVWSWLRECACGCGGKVKQGKIYVSGHYKNTFSQTVHIRGGKSTKGSVRQCIPEGYNPVKKLRSDELCAGDFLMMPRKFEAIETDVSEDLARLLGYYVAEGCFEYDRHGDPYAINLTYGEHEKDTLVSDTLNILKKCGISAKIKESSRKGSCVIRSTNDWGKNKDKVGCLLSWIIDNGGKYSHTKRLSFDVMHWPLNLKLELIKGLFRGDSCQHWSTGVKDGYESHSFHIQYGTTSEVLVYQVQLILAQLGYPGSIKSNPPSIREMKGKKVNCREFFVFSVSNPHALELAEHIWPNSEKTKKFQVRLPMKSSFMVDENFVYFPIKSIKIIKNSKPVYNLTVSGDHSYLVKNIATYNSPDRQYYPQDRVTASRWFRMFHKYDPIFGTAVDMYVEMIVSTFDLIIEDDSSKEIKSTLEYMCTITNLIDRLKAILREYLVVGEAIPHSFFDENMAIWSYIAMHNPDYMDVADSPLINMDPIVNFIPDTQIKNLLGGGSPESREFRSRLPGEFVSKVLAGQPIRMNPVNCSFIARKLHPYDIRGTSLCSRLFRILMVEDAVYNSTIATYRRNASPVKVIKLGDPASGWIPSPSQEAKVLDMLTKAEIDPQAYLIYNYGINFEAWGTNERAITMNKEQAAIDGVKLTALGLSKGFISGDANYASSKAGLQVFLRRLLSLRQFIESIWLYPKFFQPICAINDWYKAVPSEVAHRYRIKRTAQELEEQKNLIMPKIQWSNRLDPSLDAEVLGALNTLKTAFGYPVSKSTLDSYTGLDWQSEQRKILSEYKYAEDTKKQMLGPALTEKFDQQNAPKPEAAKPPGAPGSGKPPAGAGVGKGGGSAGMTSSPPGSAGEGEPAPGSGALNAPPEGPTTGGPGMTVKPQ